MKETYQKIKHIISKHDQIFVFIIMAMGVSIYALNVKFTITDELWNFSNIYKMYNGLTIYKDTNVIVTPLFFIIGNLIFKIFGANYFIFRMYNVMIYTLLLYFSYLLLKKMNVSKKVAILCMLYIYINIKEIVTAGANYNVLCVLWIIIGIIIQIDERNIIKKDILQGIIIFLVFFTKQNIGVYYILGLLTFNIIKIYKYKKYKEKIVNLIVEFGVALVLLIISLLGMHMYGCLDGFINYCVLGLSDFHQNFAVESQEYLINSILQIIFLGMITVIYRIFVQTTNEEKDSESILLIMGLYCYLIEYPIINGFHYTLARYIAGIYLIYIIQKILIKYGFMKEKMQNIIKATIILGTTIIIIASVIQVCNYKKNLYKMEKNIFYGAIMDDEYKEDIKLMCNYIQNQKQRGIDVKVVSYRAMAYMSPLKLNNKDFDLPFLGNMGYKGEDGLIEQIANLSNAKILITKNEEDKVYQESSKVRKYIMENLEQDGEIGDFMIYNSEIFNK